MLLLLLLPLQIFFENKLHFTASQIGILLSMQYVTNIVGPPFWGAVGDALHNHKLVLIGCHMSGSVIIFSLQFVKSFPLMCVLVFLGFFQITPSFSLLDHATMTWISRVGGDFGKQRLYAAVGYGISGYLYGLFTASIGIEWCFTMVLVVGFVTLFMLVRYLPDGAGDEDHPRDKGVLIRAAKHVLCMYDVGMLFVVTLLAGVTGALINSYLFLYVFNLSGDDGNITSAFIAVQTVSELPWFFLANRIIDRIGTPASIFVSVVAYGVRAIVYRFTYQPWYILPVEALHGITFGLLLAATTNYIYEAAPKGAEGTMIGFISAFQQGLGGVIASLGGGYLYDNYGPRTMWTVSGFVLCPISVLCTFAFTWFMRRRQALKDLSVQLIDESPDGVVTISTKSIEPDDK